MSGEPGGLQHVQRAERVCLEVLARVCDRPRDRHLRGEVQDDVAASNRVRYLAAITHIARDEGKPALSPQPLQIGVRPFA